MRPALLVALGFAFAGLGTAISCPDARGDGAARPSLGVTGVRPALLSLPEGHIAPVPDGPPPAHIGAAEHVAGLELSVPKPSVRKASGKVRARGLRPSSKPATPYATSYLTTAAPEGGDERAQLCFADATSAEWRLDTTAKLAMKFKLHEPAESVRAVHAERFVPGGDGHASLAVTDAWVDLSTLGVRAIARYELPLARIFAGPNGLEVYAARDHGVVQVIVRAPTGEAEQTPQEAQAVRAELGSLEVKTPEGSDASSDCGHLRLALRTGPGLAEMATTQRTAILPPLRGGALADDDASPPLRRRPFQLGVSATQSLSDAEPILSLSVGWTGREQAASDPEDGS